MKIKICITPYKQLAALMLASTLFVYHLCSYAQNSNFNFDFAFERTAQLIVMLKADYGETQEFGAGIVFGREKNRLLIATAYHIFKGAEQPKDIGVQFRSMPRNKYLPAKLLRYDEDQSLDVAVLSVENLQEQGVDVCAMPFDRLGKIDKIKRGDLVYAVGNPNGVSWATPVVADKISQANGDLIDFQSNFISKGHSGGGLLDERGNLIGMTTADAQPFGRAINLGAILRLIKKWKYTVQLDTLLPGKWTPLHMAAYDGDIAAIRFHLTDCGFPNTVDAHNATPLHYAAASGSLEAVSVLLKAGANPNILDNDGDLPLEYAIEKGCFECVKLLVNSGTKLNTQNKRGQTVLHIATDSGQQKTVFFLIQSGSDVNIQDRIRRWTPLFYAVKNRNVEMIKLFIAHGADINIFGYGETPLQVAIKKYGFEKKERNALMPVIKTLIELGADVNIFGYERHGPPIMDAIFDFNSTDGGELLNLLIKAGAKVNIQTKNGRTALHTAVPTDDDFYSYARRNSMLGYIKILLDAGANPNIKDNSGESPFNKIDYHTRSPKDTNYNNEWGKMMYNIQLLKLFIKAGAKVNEQYKYEENPLYQAIMGCQSGNKDQTFIHILLNAGADPNLKTKYGRTSMDWAKSLRDEQLIKLLEQYGGK